MSRDALHPATIEAATAALDAQAARVALAAAPGCYFCGSEDGMEAWDRESVLVARACDAYPLPQLYRLRVRPPGRHGELFAPCCACNRAGRVDGERYEAVGEEEVREWLGL